MFWRKTKRKEGFHSFYCSLFLTGCLFFASTATVFSQFGAAVSKGVLEKSPINEASGMVASRENPGFLWTHNDSGDKARIFLIDTLARLHATYYLEGVEARDWEEIAYMQIGGINYLIIGDIGDNRAVRSSVSIHIIPEPRLAAAASPAAASLSATTSPVSAAVRGETPQTDTISAAHIRTFALQYEDGPRDAEALFYDPQDELLYVITKRELQVGLYAVAIPRFSLSLNPAPADLQSALADLRSPQADPLPAPADTLKLERKATLPFTYITAADISPSGDEILIKNLLSVFYWDRKAGESVVQALSRESVLQPYQAEPQGEAIAFSVDGRGYYTLSEQVLGLPVHLYFAAKNKYSDK